MNLDHQSIYDRVRSGGAAFYEKNRGLIAVWGKEAVQFLDGLISNDMKTLDDGGEMLAAFPNAQGRLLAVVRIIRQGDRYLFETEEATREKVFQNLFRFTYAGDFFVDDLSDNYRYFELFGPHPETLGKANAAEPSDIFVFASQEFAGCFVSLDLADEFLSNLELSGDVNVPDEVREILRIENGEPLYGVDMDDTTIVPELGLEGLISYKKGCYIGQEIIARIHFRGHVAKRLTGLIFDDAIPGPDARDLYQEMSGAELASIEGKNAGRITSAAFSRVLGKKIAIAYVRYDYLAEGTHLLVGDQPITVTRLPFVSHLAAEVTHG